MAGTTNGLGLDLAASIDPTGGTAGAPFNNDVVIDFGNGLIDAPYAPAETIENEPVAGATQGGGTTSAAGGSGTSTATATTAPGGAATENSSSTIILVLAVVAIGAVLLFHKGKGKKLRL